MMLRISNIDKEKDVTKQFTEWNVLR
jgi:hypothetical protein